MVEFVRRHPFALVGALVLVALLVAGVWTSDPPTQDDNNRPRPEPVKTPALPSGTPVVPSPLPTRTMPGPSPTTAVPRPTGPTSAPGFTFTPGPLDPSDLAVAPRPQP